MVRKILALSLLAMSLAVPGVHAQTAAAGAAQPAASAVDQASVQALKDMGAFLQSLKRFGVSTELTGERVLADGQKLQHTPAAPVDRIESAMNAGQDIVGGEVCDHYAFRQGQIDWQIWIAAGGKPLPRKVVIVNRADEARPESISLIAWNLKPAFKDAVFTFTPPKGATKIEIVPRKTN